MKSRHWLAVAGLMGILLVGVVSGCGITGHPEHPTGPEHPASAGQQHTVAARFGPEQLVAKVEHPEHPATGEHPAKEHPVAPVPKPKPLTTEQLAEAIEGYVKEDTRLKGGYFLLYDKKNKEVLTLTLDKVHKERLAQTAPGVYFACSDFKTPKGKIYDLDFWMKQARQGLKVTEIMVHKEAGKPRYNWGKKGDLWQTVPVR